MKFLIKFTVDEPAVGPVLAALNSHEGVVFDHLSIEPLPEFKALPKPHAKKHPPSKPLGAQQAVMQILRDGKPKRFMDIHKAIQTFGYKGVGSTLRHLAEKGLAEKDAGRLGWWKLTITSDRPEATT